MAENGITHRLSCPHTSEQNGLVERRHRQVVEVGLTLLAQAALPFRFWSDAFYFAICLMNVLPTKILDGVSPTERLLGIALDYKFLKVFGCLCYLLLRPYNKHKLQFRSLPCVFLGFATRHKGYKCVDRTGRIYISRHVRFDERVFPYANGTFGNISSNSFADILSNTVLPVFKAAIANNEHGPHVLTPTIVVTGPLLDVSINLNVHGAAQECQSATNGSGVHGAAQ